MWDMNTIDKYYNKTPDNGRACCLPLTDDIIRART